MLSTISEQVGWRKLLDIELHELHHMLDTLMKKMKGISDDKGGTRRTQKRDEKGINVGCLLHDNARPHIGAATRVFLEEFKCEKFQHSLYIPDLAPSDYHLFLHLKKFLAGQRLRCYQDTKHVLQNRLKHLAATFCEEGKQKLVQRYDKYLNLHGV
jgi:hypothetical protein